MPAASPAYPRHGAPLLQCAPRGQSWPLGPRMSDIRTYYGVAADRCRVMPNGFDPAIFNTDRRDAERQASRDRLGVSSNEISILFVGNELHRKGFGTLIEALAEADVPEARVDVVGRVSAGDYGRRIDKLRLTEKIHWHGSTSEVFPYYAAADLFVLPTLYEPFGIVIVEALASGLPVIAEARGFSRQWKAAGAGGSSNPTDVDELVAYLVEGSSPAIGTGARERRRPRRSPLRGRPSPPRSRRCFGGSQRTRWCPD